VIQWTLDPAERDAVLASEEAKKWHAGGRALVEIACTRTPAQLWAAKQAYHERFKRSLEEDVAAHVTGEFRKVRTTSQPTYSPRDLSISSVRAIDPEFLMSQKKKKMQA
jgi:hypothetical protein